MQFHSEENLYKVVCITGPTHNLLGLEFAKQVGEEVITEPIILNANEPERLSADSVRNAVIMGVERANLDFSTDYQLRRIQFVVSDSSPVEVYSDLAWQIVRRLVTHPMKFNGVADQ